MGRGGVLFLWLGFRQANDALALLELSALAEKIDTLETLQNATFGLDGAFAFETGMLAHKSKNGVGEWSLICRKATQIPRKIARGRFPPNSTPTAIRQKMATQLLFQHS